MSFGMIVTLLAWMTHKFVSSKSPTPVMPPKLKIENASLLCGPVKFPSLSAGMVICKAENLCFFYTYEFRGGQQCQDNSDEAS